MMRRDSGFTLIEVIVTLVIVGLLASVAGMGIVTNAKVYVLAEQNTAIAQKAQFGLQRLAPKNLQIKDVIIANPTGIAFKYEGGGATGTAERSIAKVSDNIKMITGLTLPDSLTGDILLDQVDSFNLGYLKSDGTTAWIAGTNPFDDLYIITIDLVLNRNDGKTQEFSTRFCPKFPIP